MSGAVCNIADSGKRRRLAGAAAMGVLLAALVVAFFVFDLPRIARLAFALPVFVGGLSYFQARGGT